MWIYFCFSCTKEGHRPHDCNMITVWSNKNNLESDNVKWLISNTKQCPMCHKYIEKNQGCNHMARRKEAGGCGYNFCWICLGDWKLNGANYYSCNKFGQDMVKNAKIEIEKYVFYFERNMYHQKSQESGVKL